MRSRDRRVHEPSVPEGRDGYKSRDGTAEWNKVDDAAHYKAGSGRENVLKDH